jgi:hypothetical protein
MTDASPKLTYVRDLRERYDTRQQHARAASAGRETRVANGVYLPEPAWASLDARERYLVRIRAVAETRRNQQVLSHWSAAAIHGLSSISEWPWKVHTTIGPTSGGRSRNDVVKHSLTLGDTDVVEVDGLLLTSVARTTLDMATIGSFVDAVTIVDGALHVDRFGRRPPLTTREELRELWMRRMPFRGHARAADVIGFAETRADSPLESVSRVNMRLIGCPRPLLQSRFFDYQGFIGETDFDWPEFGLLGEADGDVKYLDPDSRHGRTADEVVRDERVREDRLRALPRSVTRWGWAIGSNPRALRRHLLAAGLPMGIRW